MTSFNDPVHVIDFRSTFNCATIESAKPGQEFDIVVRMEKLLEAPTVRAKGKRSQDGESFDVTVDTDHGPETHSWSWTILQDAMRVHRGKPA